MPLLACFGRSRSGSSRARQKAAHLNSLCSLVQRASRVTSLTLVIQKRNAVQPFPSPELALLLKRLGQTVGGRVLRLDIQPSAYRGQRWHFLRLGPHVIEAVGSYFPRLTHLCLGPCWAAGQGSSKRWAAALARLPPSLECLTMEIQDGDEKSSQALLAQAQLAAIRLPAVRNLALHCAGASNQLQSLARAAGSAAARLEHFSLFGSVEEAHLGQVLASPLCAQLHSLSLRASSLGPYSLGPLVACLSNLRELTLTEKADCLSGTFVAVCALQHLTKLSLGCTTLLAALQRGQEGAPPPPGCTMPAGLRHLHVQGPCLIDRPGRLAQLLLRGWVPPACHVQVEGSGLFRMSQYDAEAVLHHPGQVTLRLLTCDPDTAEKVSLPVRGMVEVGSAKAARELSLLGLPMPALYVHDTSWGPLVVENSFSNHLAKLEVLGLGLHGLAGHSLPDPVELVCQRLEAGEMPALRLLILHSQHMEASQMFGLLGSLARALEAGRGQGLKVQLLVQPWAPLLGLVLQWLQHAMHDLRLGHRSEDPWGEG